jgi:hypothetical protein
VVVVVVCAAVRSKKTYFVAEDKRSCDAWVDALRVLSDARSDHQFSMFDRDTDWTVVPSALFELQKELESHNISCMCFGLALGCVVCV